MIPGTLQDGSFVVSLSLCALLLMGCSLPSDTSHNEDVHQVERGLRPAAMAASAPVLKWSLHERMDRWNVPGVSIAVIDDGALAWARGYGVLETGGADSVRARTRFQSASISKPVAAFAALRLAGDGALALDAPVNRHLRTWAVPENELTRDTSVTLRGLLSHTAGMTVSGFPGYPAGDSIPSLVQVLNGTPPANTPPIRVDTRPGTTMRYSGGGYTVMQQLLIDVTGRSFPTLMDSLVLAPLQMVRSTFQQPLPDAFAPGAASAHTRNGAPVDGRWHTYPELAAAGLWTTAPDLARFAIQLHSAYQGQSDLLPHGLARTMMTPVQDGYGLGLTINGQGDSLYVSHSGGNRGYRCLMVMQPSTGDGAVVLTNGYGGSVLTREIMRAIAHAEGWPGSHWDVQTKPAIDLSPDQLARYAGTYASEEGSDVTIRVTDRGLAATVPVIGDDLLLRPLSDVRFFATEFNAEVAFPSGSSGAVDRVEVYLNGDRLWLAATKTE